MEFFQEPTFTAFLALILSFALVKIASFAVSISRTDDNTVVCSINEGGVAKEVTLDKGLRARSEKVKKKVKFVDDVVIRRIDRYEGSENLVVLDDNVSVGEVVVEEKSVCEKLREKSEDLEKKLTNKECFDVREVLNDDTDEKIEMLKEEEISDEGFTEVEKNLVNSELDCLIALEQRNEVELEGNDLVTESKGGNEVEGSEVNEGLIARSVEDDDDGDDDWEGIERSELEKVFAEAVNYMEYGGKGKDKEDDRLAKLGSDVQMQLYGLHKVAVEGPCHEPQPMALKMSARAKWNSWQRLGSMSQEVAMEQYVRVLSESIPEWMHDYSAGDDIQGCSKLEPVDKISVLEHERKLDLDATTVDDSTTGKSSIKKDDIV